MIKQIRLKNYALIDEAEIVFEDGLTCFLGETGAGKSIIVNSICFLTQGRSNFNLIQKGKDFASVEAIFNVKKDSILFNRLKDLDIDFLDEIIVRRKITSDNKTIIKINDCTVTLQTLTKLFDGIIEVHSQKDNSKLYNKTYHLNIIDKLANNFKLLDKYKTLYIKYKNILEKIDELVNKTYSNIDLDFYKFQYEELENAKLNLDEYNDLLQKETLYKQASKNQEVYNNLKNLYYGQDLLKDNLNSFTKTCDKLEYDTSKIYDLKSQIEYEFEKLLSSLNLETIDELEIDHIEQRLFVYSKLQRKFNKKIDELIIYKEDIFNKIKSFENKDQLLIELNVDLNNIKKELSQVANDISLNRKKTSEKFINQIQNELNELMLENSKFDVKFNQIDFNDTGIDELEFYITFNQNSDLKPLKDVASGGETSRFMLALKTVFSKYMEYELMIFDEIDTGISGVVSYVVGKKIKTISKSINCITITHLSTVAAFCDVAIYISKNDSIINIEKLNENKIIEVLSLISNGDLNKPSLDAAKLLYNKAQNENI